MKYVRRFVFVHYEDLLHIRFKKLEKVTDKLYVFISDTVSQMPVWLVKQVQEMGRDLEWIEVGEADRNLTNTLMAFTIGTLHEKVDLGVEFAILSDDERIDTLVEHICNGERACVRVKQGAPSAESVKMNSSASAEPKPAPKPSEVSPKRAPERSVLIADELEEDMEVEDLDLDVAPISKPQGFDDFSSFKEDDKAVSVNQEGNFNLRPRFQQTLPTVDEREVNVAGLADNVVRRLIRSGNRPADVSMLRSYILLHSDDATAMEYVQEMIEHMARTGEIKINDGEVNYNF
ncbi:MAG: PIN domain-containing protein [Saprospiraceae bacterium]